VIRLLLGAGTLLLAVMTLALASCGGDDGASAPASGKLDLAVDKAAFTITFPAGDLQGGAPQSIASGDFNHDGKPDLLLGAPYNDGPDGSRTDGGEAYILYGPIDGDVDLAQHQPDARILGAAAGDMLGAGVAAGDLNGDGIDDIVVGAPGSNGVPEVRTDMGEAYVVFGGTSIPATIDIASKGQAFTFQPAEGFSAVGKTFAIADVNGDGVNDLVIGAPYAGRAEGTPPGSPRTTVGEVYVIYGSHDLGGVATVVSNQEDVRLSGLNTYDQFGDSVAAGDVNGDGIADIIAGASGYDGTVDARPEAGGVFVFYGGPDLPKHKTLAEADLAIAGADKADLFGTIVSAADLNGDGRAEIVSVAPEGAGPNNDRFASGEVSVFDPAPYQGPSTGQASTDAATRIFAPTNSELMSGGLAVTAGASPRIAIGSVMRMTPDRVAAGWTYVVPAPAANVDLASSASDVLTIEGAAASDGLGGALAFADLDSDDKPELLVESAGGLQSSGGDPTFVGRIYVVRLP
jgi:hypothetical protein